jgi:hypothetical protein
MRRIMIAAAVMVVVLGLAGCGGGSNPSAPDPTSPPTTTDTVLLITRAVCQENVAFAATHGSKSGATMADLVTGARRIAEHARGGDPEIQRLTEAVARDIAIPDTEAFSKDGVDLTIACIRFE